MKRNLKLVIVLVILVVAAVAALVAVNMVSKSKDEKAAKEAAELVLISQSSDDIKSIDITDSLTAKITSFHFQVLTGF